MHRRQFRAAMALASVVVVVLAAAGAASAQAQALSVSPGSVPAGGQVTIRVTCDPDSSGYVISGAMLGHGEFAAVPALPYSTDSSGHFVGTVRISKSVVPGSYSVAARCGGGLLAVTTTLVVTAATLAATGSDSGRLVGPGLALLAGGIALAAVAGLGRRRLRLR